MNPITPTKPFYFIRHGQTDWNQRHIYMGQRDIPLNAIGIKQAQEAADNLAHEAITHIFTSPLQRAQQTANIVNSTLNVNISVIDDFQECAWGLYEEQPIQPELFETWTKGRVWEGVESFDVFAERVARGFQKTLKLPGPVLIVAHTGTYVALQKLLNIWGGGAKNAIPLYLRPPLGPDQPWFVCPLDG